MTRSEALNYTSEGYYGNLAYDLPEIEYVPGVATKEKTYSQPKTSTKIKVGKKQKTKALVTPLMAVGFAIILALAILIVFSYVELNEISVTTSEYESQIIELQADEVQLKLKYESTFDYKAIEEYALNTLGMIKSTSGQKIYLNDSNEDKAVILDAERTDDFYSEFEGIFETMTSVFEK